VKESNQRHRRDSTSVWRRGWALVIAIAALHIPVPVAAQNDQDGRISLQMAQQLEMNGRLDQAAELYASAARSRAFQRDLGPYLGAKRCWVPLNNYEPLKLLILDLQARYRDLQFEVDLAMIDYLQDEHTEAVKRWRELVVNNPVNERAYALVGTAFIDYQRYEDALWMYTHGRKSFKDPHKFFHELVRIYQALGDYRKMCQEYVTFLHKNPAQFPFVQSQLLSMTRTEGALQPTLEALRYFLKNDPLFGESGHRLLAALFTQNRQYRDALNHYAALESILAQQKKAERGQYYFSFATVALNDGALAEAGEALDRIIANKDADQALRVRARFSRAQILEKENQYHPAIEAYESFLVDHPRWTDNLQVLTRLASLYFDVLFDIPKAEAACNRILATVSLPITVRLEVTQKLAECAIARGDLQEAQHYLNRLQRESPQSLPFRKQALLMLTELDLYRGHPLTALLMLAELDLYRGHPLTALQKLSHQLHATEHKNAAAIDTVQNNLLELYLFLRENHQDSAGLSVYGHAKWLHKKREYAAAYDTLATLSRRTANTPLHEPVCFFKISLLRQMQRPQEALVICRQLLQEALLSRPDLATLRLAEIHEEIAEAQQAQEIYESFLEKYPQSIYIEQVRVRIRQLEKRVL